jgi:ATP-dependent RNA helicase HelY
MFDLFAGQDESTPGAELLINQALLRRTEEVGRMHAPAGLRGVRGRRGAPGRGQRYRPPSRVEIVEKLDSAGLLPAIVFIFSRAGCEAAVTQCVRGGLRLNSPEEAEEVRRIVIERTSGLPEGDLAVLGYWEWRDALERGVAGHHAGMLPAFKETVEELFVRGLVKVVFATETLALGINMPARTVVLERLVKYNGEAHVDLTPGEYTQLTGRAGRRGIDIEGHAVVAWQPGLDPRQVGGLASTRTYPLRSSFRPGYNMAINLVAQVGAEQARDLLEQSFAQFQADRSVVGTARRIDRNKEALKGYAEAIAGDFDEDFRPREGPVPAEHREQAGQHHRLIGEPDQGRRDRGPDGPPVRARGGDRPGPRHAARAPAGGGHPGRLVRAALGRGLLVPGRTARFDPVAQAHRAALAEGPQGHRVDLAQHRDFHARQGNAPVRGERGRRAGRLAEGTAIASVPRACRT